MALFPYLPKNMKPNRLLPLVLLLTALSAHAKDFIIYDRMDYVGKPDLTADKLSKVFLVYESELVKPDPTGKRKHGVLNEARIRELAKQSRREGYRTISTDIESWFAEKDGQLLTPDELRTDFERMYQIFREENPRAVISNYIGYIWPQYYSATNSPYFKQFIDPIRWRKMLEISKKYTDGVIIWSDKRDENNQIVRWNDPRIQATMKATQAFINANTKEIKVEGLQKY